MNNAEALRIISQLKQGLKITWEETSVLLSAIPSDKDNNEAQRLRHQLEAACDFCDIPARGRRRAPLLSVYDVAMTQREAGYLERVIFRYWEGRNPNNAEMGRLIAFLEFKNIIRAIPKGYGQATADFFARSAGGNWDVKRIRRIYQETIETRQPHGEKFFLGSVKIEAERYYEALQSR